VISGDFVTDIVTLIHEDNKMLIGARIIDWAGGWNEMDIGGKHYIIPYAEGWLLACTKIAWAGLGGFDSRYGKFDYEDVDLSLKALSLGYNVVGFRSNKVAHLGSQTIAGLNVDRMRITKKNRELFLSKWADKIPEFMKA
jgi:GT2 family glycosyltransferase